MLGNYFKIAFRNLTKRKGYALLNIATISFQAIKAAITNPVTSLRTE
jgi:hypothetical protein